MNRSAVRLGLLRLVSVSAVSAVLCVGPGAWADASSDLEKAHSAYVAHKYDDAEKRLRALLDSNTEGLDDPDAVADARMYLGAVLLAEGKKDQAAEVFEKLLLDRPDYQPDPLRVALPAIDALIDSRTKLRERLTAIATEKVHEAEQEKARIEASKQQAAARLALLEKLASEEIVIERNSRWRALVPFGSGQFQNGQTALGWTFVSSETLLLAGSVVAAGLDLYNVHQMNEAIGRNDGTASQYFSRARSAFIVGDVFAAAFGVAALVGILHAELTFVPERVEVHKRVIPPLSLSIGPGGVGLSGEF